MSTLDVPGAKAENKDVLQAGCWAEHEDKSLILVKGTENHQVVFEIYDVSKQPIVYYQSSMREEAFKKAFSYPPTGKSQEKWTWHDKTPFPWNRVMKYIDTPVPTHADVEETLTAAARVAESLKLRAQILKDTGQGEKIVSKGRNLMERIERAIDAFME